MRHFTLAVTTTVVTKPNYHVNIVIDKDTFQECHKEFKKKKSIMQIF